MKKFRQKYGHFLVEGEKIVAELLQSHWVVEYIIATENWVNKFESRKKSIEIKEISEKNYRQISSHTTPPGIAALVTIPSLTIKNKNSLVIGFKDIDLKNMPQGQNRNWVLALDGIRDPGNLGTIIRIADWYGIEKVFCSEDCVDLYNPKVLSATMGSFVRVDLVYTDLKKVITDAELPTFAFVMDGQDLKELSLPDKGLIVIGNESKGISTNLKELCNYKVKINRLGAAESLNAAIATAIACERMVNRR